MAVTDRHRRAGYPVRKTTLRGQDHDRDLENTTAAERLSMMWPLALEAWALTGQPPPAYGRGQSPVTRRPWTVRS